MYTVLAFIFGLVFGSFFNVVGLRVPKKESIAYPPSHCTSCNRQLTALDLVPVLSYVVLRGKCRTCGTHVSPIYPIMELATGILFALAYSQQGFSLAFVVSLLFISMLVIITVSDIAYMLIPNKVLLFFLPLFVVGRILVPLTPWWDSLLGAAVGFCLLYLVALLSRGGMGGGDIKLLFVLGIVLGTLKTLLTLAFASAIGLVIGIVVLRITKKGRKTPVPFGPSIALAALISYFYGETIITWYLQLF